MVPPTLLEVVEVPLVESQGLGGSFGLDQRSRQRQNRGMDEQTGDAEAAAQAGIPCDSHLEGGCRWRQPTIKEFFKRARAAPGRVSWQICIQERFAPRRSALE